MKDKKVLYDEFARFSYVTILIMIPVVFLHQGSEYSYSMSFSYYLLIPCLFQLDLVFKKKQLKHVLFCGIAILSILAYGARGPIMSIATCVILEMLFMEMKMKKKVVIFVFFAISCWLIYVNLHSIINLLQKVLDEFGIYSRSLDVLKNPSVDITSGRIDLFKHYIPIIFDNPLLGSGVYGNWISDDLGPHNAILEYLLAFGIVIGTLFLAILATIPFRMVKVKNIYTKRLLLIFLSYNCTMFLVSGNIMTSYNWFLLYGLVLSQFKQKEVLVMSRCKFCVMDDEGDRTIFFNDKGQCNYCTSSLKRLESTYFPNVQGIQKLETILAEIREQGKGKRYDCIMGISGGLDSSYLLYLGSTYGLRILGVHIDDGFDTEISKENIKKLVKTSGIDMLTIVPDEKQYYGLLKAYMLASVPNLACPQDNILFANLYEITKKHKISYFLSGGNFALENILQKGNTHTYLDVVNIKDINKKYGSTPIDKLEFISPGKKKLYQKFLGLRMPRLLDYIDYNRDKAFKELEEYCGFEYYGSKHLENIFTAFLQLYWLPRKFHVDKRKSHYSSLIVSGQCTREQALEELEKPMYDEEMMASYICMIKEKLHISEDEFLDIMKKECHSHEEFKRSFVIKCFAKH